MRLGEQERGLSRDRNMKIYNTVAQLAKDVDVVVGDSKSVIEDAKRHSFLVDEVLGQLQVCVCGCGCLFDARSR